MCFDLCAAAANIGTVIAFIFSMKASNIPNPVTLKEHFGVDPLTQSARVQCSAEHQRGILVLHDGTSAALEQAQTWSLIAGLVIQPLADQLSGILTQPKEFTASSIVVCASELQTKDIQILGAITVEHNVVSVLCMASHNDSLVAQMVDAGVSAYQVGRLSAAQLEATVAFAQAQRKNILGLERALHQTQAKLEARKIIEKAKGLLMQQNKLSENEAYNQMRTSAMNKGIAMEILAKRIVGVFEQYSTEEASLTDAQ